jgi:uncharacterized protein YjbI with pentapeptide repeats
VLSLITVVFAWQQDAHQQQIENQRAKAERKLAKQRAQDEALQAYLDQMSTLLLERDLRSSTQGGASEASIEARTLARARTLTVLPRLNGERKRSVLQFLSESGLISTKHEIVGADISVEQGIVELDGADLSESDLSDADLKNALLYDTNLRNGILRGADLSDADLSYADLDEADFTQQQFEEAKTFYDATMPNGKKYVDWLKGSPAFSDTDGDGLSDQKEKALGLGSSNPDTDGDGIPDSSDKPRDRDG